METGWNDVEGATSQSIWATPEAGGANRPSPQASTKGCSSVDTVVSAHWSPLQTPDFQKCKVKTLRCFKPFSL